MKLNKSHAVRCISNNTQNLVIKFSHQNEINITVDLVNFNENFSDICLSKNCFVSRITNKHYFNVDLKHGNEDKYCLIIKH